MRSEARVKENGGWPIWCSFGYGSGFGFASWWWRVLFHGGGGFMGREIFTDLVCDGACHGGDGEVMWSSGESKTATDSLCSFFILGSDFVDWEVCSGFWSSSG